MPLVTLAALFVTPLPLSASGGCDPLPWRQLTFSREGAFGFCPPLNAVFSARIAAKEGTCPVEYVLEMSILEEGVRGQDPCLENVMTGGVDCVKETRLPTRLLTDQEISDVFSISSRTIEDRQTERDPQCGVADPCLINVFAWDDWVRLTDYGCDAPRVSEEQAGVMINLLERLRRADLYVENGDANGDGRRDISDAVFLLSWLFLGGPPPAPTHCRQAPDCPAAEPSIVQNADTNGDGFVDLSDAVRLLNWLFLGGAEPCRFALASHGRAASRSPSRPSREVKMVER